MIKNFVFRIIMGVVAFVAAVLWLLSLFIDALDWFTLGWAITAIAGIYGILYIVRGLTTKNIVPLKKSNIYFGAGFLVVAVFACIGELTIDDKYEYVIPIIAIIVTGALLLGMVATGGKKWDEGDNEKPGYKNYYERKAEEEAVKAEQAAPTDEE